MSDRHPTGEVASPTSLPIFQRTQHQARSLGGAMTPPSDPTPGPPADAPSAQPGPSLPAEAPSPQRTSEIRDALDRLATVDWDVVATLRLDVSAEIATRFPNTPLNEASHRDTVATMVHSALDSYADQRLTVGQRRLSADERHELHRAVMVSMFGAGRLQPLLDLEGLENLEIEGHDRVTLQFNDGRLEDGPAVADSDDQLIEEIRYIARTSTTGENTFSQNRPWVRQTLPDGSRFAAEAWVTSRPSISVRKHNFIDTDLDQMRSLGAIDESVQAFLTAAIRAGKNVIVSGDPAAGKTTLVRAMLNELSPNERLATIEAQYELLMHQMPERHHRVWAAEEQPGGEIGPDGQPVGKVSLTRLIELSLQKNVTRIVVGEVVGEEVMAMMEAMQGGRGSVSTIHASSARDTIERLVTLITRARSNADPTFGYRLVAQNVDLIVHLNLIDESPLAGGRRWRFVDDIVAVEVSRDTGAAFTPIYSPDFYGRAVPTGQYPPWVDQLRRFGFDTSLLDPAAASWGAPPDLIIPPGQVGAA